MICITKNNKGAFALEYKLEVYTDNRLLYNKSVDIDKRDFKKEDLDRAAMLKLLKYLLRYGDLETVEELGKLIPIYEE